MEEKIVINHKDAEQPVMKANLELLSRFSDKLRSNFLFNKEYFGINKTIAACSLGAFTNEEDFVDYLLTETRASMPSRAFNNIRSKLQEWNDASKKLNTKDAQIAFLKEITNDFAYFPTKYAEGTRYTVDTEYPSSDVGRSKYWPCNTFENLILAAGLMAYYNNDPTVPAEFFEFILEKKPDFILGLGNYGVDFLEYIKSGYYGIDFQFRVKCQPLPDHSGTKLTVYNHRNGQAHELTAYNIAIKDNCGFCFDYKTAKFVLNLCKQIEQQTGVIHCASAIGRTGLFTTLITVYADPECRDLLNKITQSYLNQTPISEKLLDELNAKVKEKIIQIRKIRPAIATDSQASNIIHSLINITAAALVTNQKEHVEAIAPFSKCMYMTTLTENTLTQEEAEKSNYNLESDTAALHLINKDLKLVIGEMENHPFHGGFMAKFAHSFVSTIGIKDLGHKAPDEAIKEKKFENGINNFNRLRDLQQLSEDITNGICNLDAYKKRIQDIFKKTNPFEIQHKPTSKLYLLLKDHLAKFLTNDQNIQIAKGSSL